MKKIYAQPTIDVVELEKEDIITTSAGVVHSFGDLLPRPGDKPVEW